MLCCTAQCACDANRWHKRGQQSPCQFNRKWCCSRTRLDQWIQSQCQWAPSCFVSCLSTLTRVNSGLILRDAFWNLWQNLRRSSLPTHTNLGLLSPFLIPSARPAEALVLSIPCFSVVFLSKTEWRQGKHNYPTPCNKHTFLAFLTNSTDAISSKAADDTCIPTTLHRSVFRLCRCIQRFSPSTHTYNVFRLPITRSDSSQMRYLIAFKNRCRTRRTEFISSNCTRRKMKRLSGRRESKPQRSSHNLVPVQEKRLLWWLTCPMTTYTGPILISLVSLEKSLVPL